MQQSRVVAEVQGPLFSHSLLICSSYFSRRAYACIFVCIYVYTHVCVYVCVCIYIYMHIHIAAYAGFEAVYWFLPV